MASQVSSNSLIGDTASRRKVLAAGAAAASSGLIATMAGSPATAAAPIAPLSGGPSAGFLVWDLASAGYVSEEYLLPGRADIAEPIAMGDGLAGQFVARPLDFQPKILQRDAPYVTRVIVYRPRNPSRFSGNVLTECLHVGGGGHAVTFRTIHPFAMGNGDIFVGVQHPNNFEEVRAKNPARYGALHAADVTQVWGMIADAGRAVREGALAGLRGYRIERQFLSGRSFTGIMTGAFANFHHAGARLGNGANVFDGYIPMSSGYLMRPLDVPVMRINTQSEYAIFGLDARRPDSDKAGEKTRLYEVAGACHYFKFAPPIGTAPQPGRGAADGEGGVPVGAAEWLASFGPGTRQNDLPVRLLVSAAFANMYRWSRGGPAPPHAPKFETTPDGKLVLDAHGNVLGGLRMPHLIAPAAAYGAGQGKFLLFGYARPFSSAELHELYATKAAYLAKFRMALDRAVADRWLLAADGPSMLADASAVSFA